MNLKTRGKTCGFLKYFKKQIMKKLFLSSLIFCISFSSFAQNKEVESVKSVLKKYSNAVEKLDVAGTEKLFTTDSQIFESGGSEGTYAHYLEHHLTPEFKDFTSFKYSDYKVDIIVDGKYAFATETYLYTLVLAKDKTEVKRKGVATSVLKKVNGEWKIMISHNSSRR
jgi:ketosteroid isomerase-like protein